MVKTFQYFVHFRCCSLGIVLRTSFVTSGENMSRFFNRICLPTTLKENTKCQQIRSKDSQVKTQLVLYRVYINYWRISLRHNLSRKCRKIVKFVSITHSELNIWNGLIVATAIGNSTQDMFEKFWREWEYHLDICRVTRGAHIECI
jgi:hypothetical protein